MPRLLRKMTLRALFLITALLVAAATSVQAADEAALESGKQIFTTGAKPQCGICHVLADAQATGEIGPNLDALKPTEDRVRLAVKGGIGVMPAYKALTDEQIDAVARYVSKTAGKAK